MYRKSMAYHPQYMKTQKIKSNILKQFFGWENAKILLKENLPGIISTVVHVVCY